MGQDWGLLSFWRISSPKFMVQILINFRSKSILDLNQLRRSKSIFFGAWETSLLVYPNSCKSLLLFWYSRSYWTIIDLHRLFCRSLSIIYWLNFFKVVSEAGPTSFFGPPSSYKYDALYLLMLGDQNGKYHFTIFFCCLI